MKKLSLVVCLALIGAVTVGCNGEKKKQTESVEVEQKPLVKVEKAVKKEVDQTIEFTGTIEPYALNVISPGMNIRIDQILVDVGARVQKGQLLVKMDQTQYRTAEVQLANLETDYQRLKTVYEANAISKQQLDAQMTQLEVSRETVKNLMENIELRSPISGVVTSRNYDPGDIFTMTPGSDGKAGVLTVMQMDRLKVRINVSETYFPSVKTGMPVEIKLDMFPDEKFSGNVSLVYPAIDASTRTFTVEITIPNGNMKLRPGMFSRVALNFGSAERIMVPDLAVQKQVGSNERYVYIISGGTAKRQSVEVGRQSGNLFEILSGVTEGDDVAVAGISRLMDGAEVEITNN